MGVQGRLWGFACFSPFPYYFIGGSAYYELLRDNYRPRGVNWVKMTKEEAKAYDNDQNIKKIFVDDQGDDQDDSSSYPDDIDEFESNEDGHAIFPF